MKESADYKGLLESIRENAPSLFTKIMPKEEQILSTIAIPTNIPTEPKSHTSTWVAVGLDVLGAAAIGIGLYQNSQMNDYYNQSASLKEEGKEWKGTYKKAQDANSSRNIFYATGGALLLGGVAVHIWF
ncbi:hypothetical protein R83H12_01963 [Fibrobacteria bacterium R8-3-H12]